MICWKCDGDHLAANCPRWPGFEYPPERTPPHLRLRLDQAMSRDAQMKAMERIQTGAQAPPQAAQMPATLLAPAGVCPFCDARRAQNDTPVTPEVSRNTGRRRNNAPESAFVTPSAGKTVTRTRSAAAERMRRKRERDRAKAQEPARDQEQVEP